MSHSWYDDIDLKLEALDFWCQSFWTERGRAPKLWLDKCCIDQNAIKENLECLPVFLAGCNCLAAFAGNTFTSRLWCIVELFVYVSMQYNTTEEHEMGVVILPLGKTDEERMKVWNTWMTDFDAAACQCFDERDKERMMAVIEASPRGIEGFNAQISTLAASLCANTSTMVGRGGWRAGAYW